MAIITDPKLIDRALTMGVKDKFPKNDALRERMLKGERLRLYVGIDPTAPFLHLGHALQLQKLRQFQDLGHEVIMLIGSFTAMIGDPTDKMAVRKPLTFDEVKENAKNYKKQASKILKFSGDNAARIDYNHKWLAKMTLKDVTELASHFTVQQMMERDMFEKRWQEEKPIGLHEFLYPLMQGYDSVAMDVDIEVGGNDQTFNMLAGRTLLRAMKNKEKTVIALELLTNDEGKKMSKSEGGFISLIDSPEEMFGKIMAMGDGMMENYYRLVLESDEERMKAIESRIDSGENPRDIKLDLAQAVVTRFYSAAKAKAARRNFIKVFSEKLVPEKMEDYSLGNSLGILDALVATKIASSKGEARRLVEQGSVTLGDVKVTDINYQIDPSALPQVLQKGKRFFVRLTK